MENRSFIIVGGGQHAAVVVSMLRQLNKTIAGFTDPDPGAQVDENIDRIGGDESFAEESPSEVVLATGVGSTEDVSLRAGLFENLVEKGFEFPALVHPSAEVAPEATLEPGAQVMAGAIVQTGAVIGKNVIVNTNASVDHDCVIGAHSHVAPGVVLSGGVTLAPRVHVGTGASIIQGVDIGARSLIGAGAVVIEDVQSDVVVLGIPARPQ